LKACNLDLNNVCKNKLHETVVSSITFQKSITGNPSLDFRALLNDGDIKKE